MMNGTMIFASLLFTGKSLMCTRSDDSLTSMPFCCSGSDLRETVDAKMDSFTSEAETIDVTRIGLGNISKWCAWNFQSNIETIWVINARNLTFVRDVANAEEVAEGRRRRLAESWESSPREVFMALQSKSASSYSCLTAGEIYTWLTQQSVCTSVFTVDDVAEAILPFAEVYGELRYGGFLRMVLHSQATDEWLRDAIVRRGRF